ncbi:hypothetical protein [Streptomyces zagrosensis]|uniref:Uncharacterized protein n=1 Tax=Streptomyces zagrosensis TaxID=1042984 RepID=A0A7W9QGR2_9ACTN|nr:hypothetical protein [Streptomyces zagrosensis]MBB5939801.1 hypothetical protein [Streptomyces zagrosensis]
MEAELTALAASGATALVGLMVSETWTQARDRVARFFARGGDENSVDDELRLSQMELLVARAADDELTAADIEAGWRMRVRRALQADPAAADELRLLLAELGADEDGDPAGTVHNSITGGVQHGPVIQGRDFSGLTFDGMRSLPTTGNADRTAVQPHE